MYQVIVRHAGLNKYRVITGRDPTIVQEKARVQTAAWDEIWQKILDRKQQFLTVEEKKMEAALKSNAAKSEFSRRQEILSFALSREAKLDWTKQKSISPFRQSKPEPPRRPEFPPEPKRSDREFIPKISFVDFVLGRRKKKIDEAAARFAYRRDKWQELAASLALNFAREESAYQDGLKAWEITKESYEEKQEAHNKSIDVLQTDYRNGSPAAVEEYCRLVLAASEYPDCFPQGYILELDATTSTLVIDYQLPSLADMPLLKEVKYVVSRNAFEEHQHREATIKALYDSVVYQVCLRTIFELFSSDQINALKAIVFNGWVQYVSPSTGLKTSACIMTLQTTKQEFQRINLSAVDPKACFRSLKGIGSSQLHAMAPVQPIMRLNRNDKRFVESSDAASRLEEGTNIAAIGWEEFEHLIRDIFEREFSNNGGEVKVTRASRDGGVDAVVFDPDPIRGGKIVIQAKRYTNPVDVSAVRDLYGTVLNEGATKGILVTTSNFGPDAYSFAKDKPITLMDGSNLLYLLSKHGHKARIDLQEAKKLGLSMQR